MGQSRLRGNVVQVRGSSSSAADTHERARGLAAKAPMCMKLKNNFGEKLLAKATRYMKTKEIIELVGQVANWLKTNKGGNQLRIGKCRSRNGKSMTAESLFQSAPKSAQPTTSSWLYLNT